MKEYNIKIGTAFLLVLAYFGIMLSYTFLDVTTTGYQVQLLSNISFVGMMLAIGCSLLFFLLLDKGLDPIFEGIFSQSEQDYQEMIQSLIKSPMTSLIQVCVLAPVMEEILMRGVVLGGLKNSYGTVTALLVSATLFACLHFNMVQTLSAFLCGIDWGRWNQLLQGDANLSQSQWE